MHNRRVDIGKRNAFQGRDADRDLSQSICSLMMIYAGG
jgi:hypothetical protein